MDELFRLLFSEGHVPVRRELRLHITEAPNGQPVIDAVGGDLHVLAPDGSLDHVIVDRDQFLSLRAYHPRLYRGPLPRAWLHEHVMCQVLHAVCSVPKATLLGARHHDARRRWRCSTLRDVPWSGEGQIVLEPS